MEIKLNKNGSVFTFTDLSCDQSNCDLYFKSILKDGVKICGQGYGYTKKERRNDVLAYFFRIYDGSIKYIVESLGIEFTGQMALSISKKEYQEMEKTIGVIMRKQKQELEEMKIAKKKHYDKENLTDDKTLLIMYDYRGFYITYCRESFILSELVDKLDFLQQEIMDKKIIINGITYENYYLSFKDLFKKSKDDLYTYELQIMFKDLKNHIKKINKFYIVYLEYLEERKKAREKAREEKINVLIEKAKETGEKQIVETWVEDCNDPNEECDVDQIVKYIDWDGKITFQRNHTW